MAEVGLYLTEKDELIIVAAALAMGCRIIPDVNYPSAEYESLSSGAGYTLNRLQTRLFYFWSRGFSRYPIELCNIEKDGRSVYFIAAGGPVIHFMGGGVFDEDGSSFIRPGFISHSVRYRNTSNGSMEKPPIKLITAYKSLVKIAQKSATRIKPGKRVFWLGPDARKAVENGTKLVGFEKYSAHEILK